MGVRAFGAEMFGAKVDGVAFGFSALGEVTADGAALRFIAFGLRVSEAAALGLMEFGPVAAEEEPGDGTITPCAVATPGHHSRAATTPPARRR
jgi:hypothetical protein